MEIKSSAPLSRPTTRSYSVFFAVSMITGMRLVAAEARSFCRMERPSSSGSIISSKIKAGWGPSIALQKSEGRSKPWAS